MKPVARKDLEIGDRFTEKIQLTGRSVFVVTDKTIDKVKYKNEISGRKDSKKLFGYVYKLPDNKKQDSTELNIF